MWKVALEVILCLVGLAMSIIFGLKARRNLQQNPKHFLNRYYLGISIAQSGFLVSSLALESSYYFNFSTNNASNHASMDLHSGYHYPLSKALKTSMAYSFSCSVWFLPLLCLWLLFFIHCPTASKDSSLLLKYHVDLFLATFLLAILHFSIHLSSTNQTLIAFVELSVNVILPSALSFLCLVLQYYHRPPVSANAPTTDQFEVPLQPAAGAIHNVANEAVEVMANSIANIVARRTRRQKDKLIKHSLVALSASLISLPKDPLKIYASLHGSHHLYQLQWFPLIFHYSHMLDIAHVSIVEFVIYCLFLRN